LTTQKTSPGIEKRLAGITGASGSRLFLEEAFAYAMLMKLLPAGMPAGESKASGLLTAIDQRFPDFFNEQRTEAFDLLARFEDPAVLRVGARLAATYNESGERHPVKSFYSGRIYESLGETAQAVRCYETVADGTSFLEQPVKHTALLFLGRHYERSDPQRAKRYLKSLIEYKEMIGVRDNEFEKATQLINSLTTPPPVSRTNGSATP
jgi:hypothetical protein